MVPPVLSFRSAEELEIRALPGEGSRKFHDHAGFRTPDVKVTGTTSRPGSGAQADVCLFRRLLVAKSGLPELRKFPAACEVQISGDVALIATIKPAHAEPGFRGR